ncbi:glucokinase regulator family [Grosmannia clavigera kw1407]|uniref:N-acetyl-D-glucosamine kinase n=1 Tax=Grosmannia clavigera (strain kw1407 / UAMH 11150) TaxID=655863 RepID=F0XIA7_GROCL|nr:glucokinase regulator family [Grosmannia clavigera kw1407]EFX03001.1 glucokinase regulator family [Grosmannia clavigera kw1407]
MVLGGLQGTASANALSTKYFLAVDGGGSSCTVVLLSSAGVVSVGEAGPCNVTTMGMEAALAVISAAIRSAVSTHPDVVAGHVQDVPIASAWVGMAGYDRPHLAAVLDAAVSELLGIPAGNLRLTVSSDIDLLSVKAASERSAQTAVVLVAGTGSVAMSFQRSGDRFTRTARAGGWGSLLGDDGSGFAIGKAALRLALRTSDTLRNRAAKAEADGMDSLPSIPPLSAAVYSHFEAAQEGFDRRDLLSGILAPPATTASSDSTTAPQRIARAAQVVLALAESDDEARAILQEAAASLADMVTDLVRDQGADPANIALITAGGVLKNRLYNSMVQQELSRRGSDFKWTMNVQVPALEGARWLAANYREQHRENIH